MLARHVTIVGGYAGVSGEDEVRLRAAGVDVYRLNGATEAETIAMLDALVAADTPWPGAPPQTTGTDVPEPQIRGATTAETPIPDEWTVPDDAVPPPAEPILEPGDSVRTKVQVPPPTDPVAP